MPRTAFVLLLSAFAFACSSGHGEAKLSDGWVVASGGEGSGFYQRPSASEGQPLAAGGAGSSCLTDAQLLAAFGKTCDHESENADSGGGDDSGGLSPGIPKTKSEVRWYCSGELAVRVVLRRCSTSGGDELDGVTPIEVAVKTKPSGPK